MFEWCETGFELREKRGISPSSWHMTSWHRFMSVLASWTGKQYALRASEYCHTPDKERWGEVVASARTVRDPHTLRPEDVFVSCKDGQRIPATEMKHYASLELRDVDFIQFYLRSAKNITGGNYEVEHARPGISPMIDDFIWMHLIWMRYARWQRGDIYFSMRYPLGEGPLKQLIPKMVTEILRTAVSSLGGNPARYGTKSLKVGGITDLYHAGASEADLMALGRHAAVGANRHYRRNVPSQDDFRAGPFALRGDRALTVGDILLGSPEIRKRRTGGRNPPGRR